jgi:abortive infection bacteriophage resistance protein
MNANQPFLKPALSVDEHLILLKQRGLVITDDDLVKHYLRFIGYYRLRGYFIPFHQKGDPNHTFLPGTTFETILEHYSFDRELRLLSLDALERIENAFKAAISDVMCIQHGPHWYTDERFFSYGNRFAHIDYLIALREDLQVHQKTLFLSHYYQSYGSPEFPPSWMLFQILSFGFTSKLFKNLRTEHQKAIAQRLEFDHVLILNFPLFPKNNESLYSRLA